MDIKPLENKKIKIDINQMISKNLEHFIPLQLEHENSTPLFLFLSHENLEKFREILSNKEFDRTHAKSFISNSSEGHSTPIISDSELNHLLTLVTQDTHLMKNLLFAITMQNAFNNM